MAIRFNKLVRPDQPDIQSRSIADDIIVRSKAAGGTMVFMSHKTGDDQAEREAKRITRQHRVEVYMAEWDDDVVGDSNQLPDHIMNAIRQSKGFLVSVIPAIAESMWVGYEIVSGEKRHMLTLGKVEAISAVTARETLARGLHSFGLIK